MLEKGTPVCLSPSVQICLWPADTLTQASSPSRLTVTVVLPQATATIRTYISFFLIFILLIPFSLIYLAFLLELVQSQGLFSMHPSQRWCSWLGTDATPMKSQQCDLPKHDSYKNKISQNGKVDGWNFTKPSPLDEELWVINQWLLRKKENRFSSGMSPDRLSSPKLSLLNMEFDNPDKIPRVFIGNTKWT